MYGVNQRSMRMNISTFSSIQTKYGLKARSKDAKTMFIMKDVRHDAIDPNLACNLRNAHTLHIREEEARNVLEEKHEKFSISKPSKKAFS